MSQQKNQFIEKGEKSIKLQVGNQQIELLKIPAGAFLLGSKPTEPGHRASEYPIRRITISKPFYMGRYEITQGQYKAVTGENPSKFVGDDRAVDQITFAMAKEFCRKLSALVGKHVTLPTEAQWEYAGRAGVTTRFYSGNTESDLDRVAWSRRNSLDTVHPVGQKEANAFGLYDMLGNVWEHCLDVLPDYASIAEVDPVGEMDDDAGSMRGGGWMNDAEYCRAACSLRTSNMFGGAGIRIILNSD